MALGELISEYKGRITSMKVLPFESGGQAINYEATQLIEISGRLNAHGMGSNYVQQSTDGTSRTRFYGVLTSTEGETLLVEAGGMSIPFAPGRAKFRTTATFKTSSPQLVWLNTMAVAFEGEGNFSSMEVTGKLYEWC